MKEIITDLDILREKSYEVREEDVNEIVEELQEAIKTAWTPGVGLAAIQIGYPKRVGWYRLPDKDPVILVNPEILDMSGKYIFNGEGCLSIPNQHFLTERFRDIKIKNHGRIFVAEGFEAVVIQHEIDHMEGILCLDRVYQKAQGRNTPCLCGSGKKYKKCCGR